MADPILDPSGLAKANFFGQSDSGQQDLLDAAQQAQDALQQRYANPNWFNVAAGFLKPQLGGFAASLGSANQALGDWQEKQRANELPIAQYRAQVALMKNQMGQKQAANEIVSKHTGPVTEDLLKQVIARVGADSPVAQGIKAQLEGERANQSILSQQQTLRSTQYGQAMTDIQQRYLLGKLTKDQAASEMQAAKETYGPTPPVTSARPVGGAGTTERVESAPVVNAPAAPMGRPAFDVTKNYGTPAKLLDNLKGVESSGNATAINPDSKAMGAYQFTPDTAKMLHDNGIKFNPFDEKESRAAADYYLNTLKDQHGGDWNKALAAYGGFKTKDPTKYVNKVTKGVDFSEVPLATAGSKTPPQTYESAGAPGAQATALTAEQLAKGDKSYESKIATITNADPRVTERRTNDYIRAAKLLADPEVQQGMAQRFKEKGFATAFKEALAKGFNAAIGSPTGGWNASVSAPVDEVITAYSVDPTVRGKLIELNRIALNDSLSDLREGTQALGGGHASTTEYMGLMNRIANTNEPHKLMQQYFGTRAVSNSLDAKLHDLWVDYTNQPNFAQQPVGNFFKSEAYKKAIKDSGKDYRTAQSIAD